MPIGDGVSCNGLKTRLAVALLLLVLSAGAAHSVSAAMLDVGPDVYEPDDTWEQATELLPGIPQWHNFRPVGTDEDWLTFTLTETSEVVLQTDNGGGIYDLHMWLYDSSLTLIGEDDDDGLHGHARIERYCTVDELPPGTYYVKVNERVSDSTKAGYNINLTTVSPCPEPDEYELNDTWEQATEIVSGTTQVHSLRPSRDQDWITFTLPVRSGVKIDLSGEEYWSLDMWLYDATLTEVDYRGSGGPDGYPYLALTCGNEPLPAGTYYLKLTNWHISEVIPSYTISFDAQQCSYELTTPVSVITDTTPRYRWTEVPGATAYELWVTTSFTYDKVWRKTYLSRICESGICAVTPQRPHGDGSYRWTVTAFTPDGEVVVDSGAYSISSSVPELIGPLRTIRDTTPRYRWTTAESATAYELLVTDTVTGGEVFRKTYAPRICEAGRCAATPQFDLPLGDYTWQVQVITSIWGYWSESGEFSIQ